MYTNTEAANLIALTIKDCYENVNRDIFAPLLEELYQNACQYLLAREEAVHDEKLRDSSVQIHLEKNAIEYWNAAEKIINRLRLKGAAFVSLHPDQFMEAYKLAWEHQPAQQAERATA